MFAQQSLAVANVPTVIFSPNCVLSVCPLFVCLWNSDVGGRRLHRGHGGGRVQPLHGSDLGRDAHHRHHVLHHRWDVFRVLSFAKKSALSRSKYDQNQSGSSEEKRRLGYSRGFPNWQYLNDQHQNALYCQHTMNNETEKLSTFSAVRVKNRERERQFKKVQRLSKYKES